MATDDIELSAADDEGLDLELAEMDDISLEGEVDVPIVYDDEMAENLVPVFAVSMKGRKFLKDTCSQIIEEVQGALEDTEPYRQECAKIWKLFIGDIPKKKFPFEHAANIHVPMVMENILLIASQSWAELFPNWQQVFSVMPLGNSEDDEKIAAALTVHGNWQLRKQIPGFKTELARGLLMFYLYGDVPCHSYYDEHSAHNCHEMLTADEFVRPYAHKSSKPDYSDLPWYCKRLWRQRHELERERGRWEDVDAVLEGKGASWDSDYEPVVAVTANTSMGFEQPDDDKRAPFELYQYEGWLSLPEMEEQRWCWVIVEPKSRIVLQFRIYEEENWQDRARHNLELQQRDDYFAARAEREVAMMQQQEQLSIMGDAAVMGDPAAQMQLQELSMQEPPEEPVPPEWMKNPEDPAEEPEPVRMQPIRMYSRGVNIEPLAGNLGVGHGRIQGPLNRTTNTLYNQFIDAGTLANCQTLVKTDSVEFEEPFTVGPGKVNTVRGIGPNLKDHLMPLSFPPANPQLADMADRTYQYAKGAAQANEVLAGSPGKSGEPAKLHQARLAQATKMIAVPAEKFRDFFELILQKNAKLNALYLREEELYWVPNEITKHQDQHTVRREWYDRNYSIEIRADLTFEGKEARISQADGAAALVSAHPITANDASMQYAVLKRQLEARELYELVARLPPPPQPGMPMAMYMSMLAMGPPGMGQALGLQPGGAPGAAPGEQQPGGGQQPPVGQVDPGGGAPQQQSMSAGPPPQQ